MLRLVGLGTSSHIRVMARSWEQRGVGGSEDGSSHIRDMAQSWEQSEVGGGEDGVALLLCSGCQPVPVQCSHLYVPGRVFSVSFSCSGSGCRLLPGTMTLHRAPAVVGLWQAQLLAVPAGSAQQGVAPWCVRGAETCPQPV